MKYYWTTKELADHWSLNFDELELLKTKPESSHLPFCIQLKYYQYFGSFPSSYNDLSDTSLKYLMNQLDIDKTHEYDWKGRTAQRHRLEILDFLGFEKPTDEDRESLKKMVN